MHSKSDNIEIMINDKRDDVIDKIFHSILCRYKNGLETPIRDANFTFHCVHLLYYKCHKISFKLGGSYIASPDRIKIKKATVNSVNKTIINAFNTL